MRLIDAKEIERQVREAFKENPVVMGMLLRWIRKQPTIDAVHVVRCKDCKYIRPEVDAYTQEVVGYWCSFLDIGSIQDEHFCSYGKRRGDTDG